MENEKNPQSQPDSGWIDEILSAPAEGQEIGPDEHAVSSAGLIHHEDAELERIITETKAMDNPHPEEDYLEVPAVMPDSFETAAIDPAAFSDEEESVPAEDYPEEPLLESSTEIFEAIDMSQAYSDELPPDEIGEEVQEAPVRKRRPRMKKGYGLLGIPHILATVIWLAIAVAIGVSLGRTLWVCAADVLAFGREESLHSVTITASDNMETIANKLKTAGLIRYPGLFKLYADITVEEGEITPGTYTLSTLYDYHALVKSMNTYSSARETVEVLIPEGYTCAQIFALLEEKGVCSAAELEDYAANGEIKDYWFLEGLERGTPYCLEGFLFPDTYEFYVGDSAGRVLGKLLGDKVGGFEVRFTELMKEKLTELNTRLSAMMKKNGFDQAYIDEHQMTIHDVVTVASMVEKESTGADAYDVSSVIYNRLTNAKKFPYLAIDATIIYALGGNIDPETGNVKPLTREDLEMDHPYNSYIKPGLIPGPISNPGTNSLLAALDPNESSFYFYVYDHVAGVHLFSKNEKEHNKNVEYVRSLDD